MNCNLKIINKCWYQKSWLTYLLMPFSWLFYCIVTVRRWLYKIHVLQSTTFNIPIIIVGNITVGGTGKTPLVIWLVNELINQGYKPAVISRGYGASRKNQYQPIAVTANSDPKEVGDEPILIAKRTQAPVYVCAKRVAAVKQILQTTNANILISDDGLQHYALARDIEICVLDSERKFGNGYLLPAGPMREGRSRLASVDFMIVNGEAKIKSHEHFDKKPSFTMQLVTDKIYNFNDPNVELDYKKIDTPVHAVAGIGNPKKFFNQLRQLGLQVIEHPFPDHYYFNKNDLNFGDDLPIIVTEKDAVKLKNIPNNLYCLAVTARLEKTLTDAIITRI